MAIIYPEEIFEENLLNPDHKKILQILRIGLSDEWEFHTSIENWNIQHFLIINPEFGVFIIIINQIDKSQMTIEHINAILKFEIITETVIKTITNENSTIGTDTRLAYAVSFGIIFSFPVDDLKVDSDIRKKLKNKSIELNIETTKNSDIDEFEFIKLTPEIDYQELSNEDIQKLHSQSLRIKQTISSKMKFDNCGSKKDIVEPENRGDLIELITSLNFNTTKINHDSLDCYFCNHLADEKLSFSTIFWDSWIILEYISTRYENDLINDTKSSLFKAINEFNHDYPIATISIANDNQISVRMSFLNYSEVNCYKNGIQTFLGCIQKVDKMISEMLES